jgi:hypothetical protein
LRLSIPHTHTHMHTHAHTHRREDYRLFWPDRSEFVRMASVFNATIVPFAAVGCADSFRFLFDSKVCRRVCIAAGLLSVGCWWAGSVVGGWMGRSLHMNSGAIVDLPWRQHNIYTYHPLNSIA